jgi:hypothetical protein
MDLRRPVGLLFLLLGGMLAGYGAFSGDRPVADPGFNVNLWWGSAMFAFGLLMSVAASRARQRERNRASESARTKSASGRS